jgi:hypothetical protein
LSGPERRLLVEAVLALGLARVAVRLIAFHRLARLLKLSQGVATDTVTPSQSRHADAVGWAIRAAAARLPWQSTCLTQTVAASAMLRRRGIPGTLYLGVAENASSGLRMAAHAWLACGEAVLVGEAGRERFTTLARFS